MVDFWADWCKRYPIVSIEDAMAEDDWNSFSNGKSLDDFKSKRKDLCNEIKEKRKKIYSKYIFTRTDDVKDSTIDSEITRILNLK